jgi:hypothetical protein
MIKFVNMLHPSLMIREVELAGTEVAIAWWVPFLCMK